MTSSGIVFDMQRFSIHDGPGIRTTVFFKGCSLHCFWCHNPEGITRLPQIQFYPGRCIACGECVAVCPQHAQELHEGERIYRRDDCVTCGECVARCDAEGLLLVGRNVSVDDVMAEVLRDRTFYETSGGGVTLSGGEPLMQTVFARDLLSACKDAGVHTAVETCAHVPWSAFEAVIPLTDLFMVDLKQMDSARHRAATGTPNERVLENARQLAAAGRPIIFRTPVVPTVNDTREEIACIAGFVAELAALGKSEITLELLPFHRMAADKYRSLGLDYRATELVVPSKVQMDALREVARAAGAPLTPTP